MGFRLRTGGMVRLRVAVLRLSTAVVLLGVITVGVAAQSLPPRLAGAKEIRDMLAQRIEVQHQSGAIVVGVITKRGREVISYGKFDKDDPRVAGGQTVFEIGSITKTTLDDNITFEFKYGDTSTIELHSGRFLLGLELVEHRGRHDVRM